MYTQCVSLCIYIYIYIYIYIHIYRERDTYSIVIYTCCLCAAIEACTLSSTYY